MTWSITMILLLLCQFPLFKPCNYEIRIDDTFILRRTIVQLFSFYTFIDSFSPWCGLHVATINLPLYFVVSRHTLHK